MRSSTQFVCQQCGYSTPRWMGQCPSCGQWNTLVESVVAAGTKNSLAALYAAESGVEWCLRIYRLDPAGLTPKPVMANGATYTDKNGDVLSVADCQSSPIKVIGNNRGVTRSYEITL